MIGFTNGCFDLLHKGHLHFLAQCRRQCERLVVAINDDASVRKLKGEGRPVDDLATRIGKVRATGFADVIAVFRDDVDLHVMLRVMQPGVMFKGAEYEHQQIIGHRIVPRVIRVPMLEGVSTTKIIKERA